MARNRSPSGHGWVIPLPTGAKARCGGPGLCPICRQEAAEAGIAISPASPTGILCETCGNPLDPERGYSQIVRGLTVRTFCGPGCLLRAGPSF